MVDTPKQSKVEFLAIPVVSVGTPPKAVDERFKDLLIELVFDVIQGAKISAAKQLLHNFIDELSQEDINLLLPRITNVSKRITDIASSLAGETPALVAKMQQLKEPII